MRYSVVRITETLIHVLDSNFGNLPAAKVFRLNTVDGMGWKLQPQNVGRKASKKLHATPEQAIASMKYMTLKAAREALTVRENKNEE